MPYIPYKAESAPHITISAISLYSYHIRHRYLTFVPLASSSSTMFTITGFSGKLSSSVLNAILTYDLIPASEPVLCTTSNPHNARWDALKAQGAIIRHSSFDDMESRIQAFNGCNTICWFRVLESRWISMMRLTATGGKNIISQL